MKLPISKEWSGSEGAQMIRDHQKRRRPAWLWDSEGETLIWQNNAARLFLAKMANHRPKKDRLKLAKPAIPIQGQIHHLLRLGTLDISSPARVRFLVGNKPVSITCSCTPVLLENGQSGLMIVAKKPIKSKLFKKLKRLDKQASSDENTDISEPEKTVKKEKPKKSQKAKSKKSKKSKPKNKKKKKNQPSNGPLSGLVDLLSHSSKLFEPLSLDESIDPAMLKHKADASAEYLTGLDGYATTENLEQWRIVGRGFTSFEEPPEEAQTSADAETKSDKSASSTDMESSDQRSSAEIERVAEYNFAELSRILEDKVGGAPVAQSQNVDSSNHAPALAQVGNTINLSQEVLVLNRLPVGILIFCDQDILFANRAMADLTGNSSISELKANGLSAIFPRVDDQDSALGPVLSIINTNGDPIKVDARLQSINWQDRPALMLNALAARETHNAQSAGAKAFVQAVTEAQNDGYFEIDRNGIFTKISKRALELLDLPRQNVINRAIIEFINKSQRDTLRVFMEKPAKTAETNLPLIELESEDGTLGYELFSQGSAGIVNGYFGAISPLLDEAEIAPPPKQGEVATLLLARLSRGIRRPLNTIMGFSELIAAESFGEITNKRYVEYAGDIQSAGTEISNLTDELDEYARLEDEEYAPEKNSFNLMQLLNECMGLVRNEANRRQVFVRSAISEDLPNILADRASLRQAMLNLLASAISQTPMGGKVILSAQTEDDGSVGVHVRDSSAGPGDIDNQFVVFREKDTQGKEAMVSMKSSMGLALTRSLISINSCALLVDPSAGTGTLMSLVIPLELLDYTPTPATN